MFDEAGNLLLLVCQIVVNETISVVEGFLFSFCIGKFNVPGLQNKYRLANLAGRTVFILYLSFKARNPLLLIHLRVVNGPISVIKRVFFHFSLKNLPVQACLGSENWLIKVVR